MPRGSTAKGVGHMQFPKFSRYQSNNMRQKKRLRLPDPDFVPTNRNERRAIAALQRKKRTNISD